MNTNDLYDALNKIDDRAKFITLGSKQADDDLAECVLSLTKVCARLIQRIELLEAGKEQSHE